MAFDRLNPQSLKQPVKAYSNGLVVPIGDAKLVFVTGQVAQDIDGNVVAPDDPSAQADYIFGRINEILGEAGLSLDDVVKAQIFVTNMDHSAAVSAVRDVHFAASKPVSTLVEVNRLVKPGCCVEIEVIAVQV